jgi:apolipoprotein N-acyltransferase
MRQARQRRVSPALVCAALAGVLHTAAFSPTEAWWLQPLALSILFYLARDAQPGRAAQLGGVFGVTGLCTGLWWLHISLNQFGHLPWLMAAAAVLLLALFLASYFALALGLAARWVAPGPWRMFAFAAAWLLAELARGSWFTGFAWMASGYAHTVGPLAYWAPWVGVYGITALAAGMAAGGALALQRRWRPALLGLLPLAGLMLPQGFTESTGRIAVSLVQPSIAQDLKFEPGSLEAQLVTLSTLVASSRGQIVVTPESVVPLPLSDLPPDYLAALASPQRPVLLGTFLGGPEQGYTNSMVALDGGPLDQAYSYGKRHLLPFGEVIPPGLGWFVRALQIPMDSQQRGQHQRAWHVAGQRLRPLICYEDLFGEDFVDSAVGEGAATVLVNLSNLAWFGTVMIQDQHLQFSQMRALEFQRPFVRSTNTGATAALDHHGRVIARLAPLARGVLEVEVEGRSGSTPYARWLSAAGLWPLWAVGLAALAFARAGALRRGSGAGS